MDWIFHGGQLDLTVLGIVIHRGSCRVMMFQRLIPADVTESHEITKWGQAEKYLLVPNETVTYKVTELDLLWSFSFVAQDFGDANMFNEGS
ncbi:hypothetical protein EYF80_002932 [Liparis tanakae]|uniref:Uncharacterized protein n=1 Tax=Liparis tanakae TaxID=230148 RepID=A0A4Z2J974_9TELE|nr:hypothetical protein EYF80_002932 [Liparis tanakae]